MSEAGPSGDISSLKKAIKAIDDDLSAIDIQLEELESQKHGLIAKRKALNDQISTLKLQKIAQIDWSSKGWISKSCNNSLST